MNNNTTLLRQVHPSFMKGGEPTSQTFNPTREHEYKLSNYDGDQISPETSWRHYTNVLCKSSAGVLGLLVAHYLAQGLTPIPDQQPDFPEHVSVDFAALSRRKREDTAKDLRDLAVINGWLYRANI